MSRYTEDDAKSIIPALLLDLSATEAAVVLRGIHRHLLSMLVDALFLIIIRVLQFFNHILYDTKGQPLSCVWNLNLKERCNSNLQ